MNLILVDDDPDEAYILKQALTQIDEALDLIYFESGDSLLPAIKSVADKKSVVLLDLNMPHYSGIDLLKNIKKDTKLNNTPVIMYSNSSSPQDIQKCYDNGANSYVKKPQGLGDTKEFLSVLSNYWQRINKT
ncbi:MAG: response regulator [Gammaproteobacteria bacterium]|nr:response regulator [Gammaproteobacteria bacterium]